jgi:hypothetical protein
MGRAFMQTDAFRITDQPLRRAALSVLLLFVSAGAHAYTYDVAAAPALAPTLATARVYLAPFKDSRKQRDLWKGNSRFEFVAVEAEDLSGQAKAWSDWDYEDLSFLWQRQLGQALAGAGFAVAEAPAPLPKTKMEQAARFAGASYLVDGEIKRLDIGKRGSDGLFGTNFSGTDYTFTWEAHLRVEDLASGNTLLDKVFPYTQVFHDPTRLGRRDKDTFPVYFAQGLGQAAQALSKDLDLRTATGLAGSASPTALEQPYWVNPHTGKRMDPSWNFDPADGTPRKDFVLRQPSVSGGKP